MICREILEMIEQQMYIKKIQQLKDEEYSWTSGRESSKKYAEVHFKRHNKIISFCKKYKPGKKTRVLDIGRSNLSVLLSNYYSSLTTLGFDLADDDGGHRELSPIENCDHIVFDLNRSEFVEEWPAINEKFDLIVFSETVEHLPIAPEFVLLFLNSLLNKDGVLILTTPNAASIIKRRILLFGKNPFERIRFNLNNPGHFREYTKDEVIQFAKKTDYTIEYCKTINFALSKGMIYVPIIGLFGDFNCDIVAILRK